MIPESNPTITGSRGGNAALADLLTKLASFGLIPAGPPPDHAGSPGFHESPSIPLPYRLLFVYEQTGATWKSR